jgi:hypothetical protein
VAAPITTFERNRPVGEARSKGNALNAAVDFVRTIHPAHWQPTLERLEPASRELLAGIVVAGAWYPFDVFHDLTRAFCEVIPGGMPVIARAWGARTIDRDFQGGIYRAFLRVSSPLFLLRTFGRLWGLYHATGALVVVSEKGNSARLLVHGLHRPATQLMYGVIGSASRLLELAGSQRVRHKVIAGAGTDDRYCEWETSF